MQLLNHLKKRRANGRERHVVFSENRWKQYGRDFLALLMLGSVLSLGACGGGGGGSSNAAASGSGTAQLGYISGGSVKLFDLSNLNQPIATTTSSTSINPTKAGSFSFSGVTLSANKYYLIEISGGFDIDVNDDGIIDTTTQAALKGKVYSLAKGSALTSGNVRINALSDMAYQRIKGSLSTLTVAQIDAALTKSAKAYLYDVNGDGQVDQTDILAFDPAKDRLKTIRPYKDILDIYVPKLHRGDTDAVKLSSLMYLNAPKIVVANGNLQTAPFTLKASITNIPGNTTTKWFFNGIAKSAINEAIAVDGIYAVTAKIYQGLSLLKTVQTQVIGSTNVAVATVNVDITKDNTVFVTDASKSSLAGAQVIIPKGALAKNTIITIKKASINQIPGTDGAGISDVIVMEPSGLTFSKPVQIRLPYNPNVNLTGMTVRIARYSADGVVDYIAPLFVDQKTHEVVFETSHFTQFVAETNLWWGYGGIDLTKNNQPIIKELEAYTGLTYTVQQWVDILNTTLYGNFTVYDFVITAMRNDNMRSLIDVGKYSDAYYELYGHSSLAYDSWKSAKSAFEFMSTLQGGVQSALTLGQGLFVKGFLEAYGAISGTNIPTDWASVEIYNPIMLGDILFKKGMAADDQINIQLYKENCYSLNTIQCTSSSNTLKNNKMLRTTKLMFQRYDATLKYSKKVDAIKLITLYGNKLTGTSNSTSLSKFIGKYSKSVTPISAVINTTVPINIEIKTHGLVVFKPQFELHDRSTKVLKKSFTPVVYKFAKNLYTTTLNMALSNLTWVNQLIHVGSDSKYSGLGVDFGKVI